MVFNEAYNELAFYTLAHSDQLYFIHQHIVDAQTAQVADTTTKQISLVFALVGLYLAVERGHTGREVQQAHMKLAKDKSSLPAVDLPVKRGDITATDVMYSEPGEKRDYMIKAWCASVWEAYKDSQRSIAHYTAERIVK